MNPTIERGFQGWSSRGVPFLVFRGFKVLTLDIAASIFLGVERGPETTRMNRVFEDLVAASMSFLRLRLPGTEFYRGLRGREFMIDYFSRMVPARCAAPAANMLSRLCRAESEEGARFNVMTSWSLYRMPVQQAPISKPTDGLPVQMSPLS